MEAAETVGCSPCRHFLQSTRLLFTCGNRILQEGSETTLNAERTLQVIRPGTLPYAEALELQRRCVSRVRKELHDGSGFLILLRHEPVVTIGRRGDMKNVLVPEEQLENEGVKLSETNRGGDVTYHGPGQVVGYPIIPLDMHGKDVHLYLRKLESVLIETLQDYGIQAQRVSGLTGVWVDNEKIAAIGVAISHWITYHGFALNVDPNMEHFKLIRQCGIEGKGVTSIRRVLGRKIDESEVEDRLVRHFEEEFGFSKVKESPLPHD